MVRLPVHAGKFRLAHAGKLAQLLDKGSPCHLTLPELPELGLQHTVGTELLIQGYPLGVITRSF